MSRFNDSDHIMSTCSQRDPHSVILGRSLLGWSEADVGGAEIRMAWGWGRGVRWGGGVGEQQLLIDLLSLSPLAIY